MLRFFRRASKSKIGTWIMAAVLIAIVGGFAVADMSNFGSGNLGFGGGSSNLVKVGNQQLTDREISETMQRRLQQVRQQQPEADYPSIIGDLMPMIEEFIDQKTMIAFAQKFGFPLSKRLVDAEIAQIPQTKGLNGQFNEQAYQAFLAQQRLSDAEVREVLGSGILQRLMLTPVAANARVSVGMARPYASMLLEAREGEGAIIPVTAFQAGLNPSDAELQQFYTGNRSRYMVPEQRSLRIARIGPDQVAGVTASDQEITQYYNARKAEYAGRETRNISQAVVQDQATANAIAARAKGGATMQAAAAPAGANAAVTMLTDQTRQAYSSVAGEKAAAAVFAASAGTVVGPVQTDFGWAVAKVDAVKSQSGKSLAQVRAEIAPKLTADKRKAALEEIVDRVQTAVDDGANFAEAAAAAKLPVTTTPLLTANGTSRSDAAFKLPPELAPALKAAFEIASGDPPEIVSLGADRGYAMAAPDRIVPAAAAPIAEVRDRVRADWIANKAAERARVAAKQIEAKVARGMPLAQAVKESGVSLPAVEQLAARRIQIANAQGEVPPAMRMLFTLGQGKSRMFADPQGRGFVIVKVNKITPGNAVAQPELISQMQGEMSQGLAQDYAREFLAAMRKQVGVKRNESAIEALRKRLVSGTGG
ncbi:MAG TPA: peptidyl-prolyl cis-trans isomerase [Sphingomicrobium sp.]